MSSLLEAKKLIEERDTLDSFIAEQEAVLLSNGVDMTTPLVDNEDYPVANVDICAVRNARKSLICAYNDRRNLCQEIEQYIYKAHEEARTTPPSLTSVSNSTRCDEVHRTSNSVFAKIERVVPESPAETAGLVAGDKIIQFGFLHAEIFKDLKQFEEIVKDGEGSIIKLTVLREERPLRILLAPKRWSGPGLLGCSILPLKCDRII